MSVVGHAPYGVQGHPTPSNGPAWLPGQMQPNPQPLLYPHGHGPIPNHAMFGGGVNLPGMGPPSGTTTVMAPNYSSPFPTKQTSSPAFAGLPLPLHGQLTGGRGPPNLAASPLAGSLSAGTLPASFEAAGAPRGSLAPSTQSSDATGHARATSISPPIRAGLLLTTEAEQPFPRRSISPVTRSEDASVPFPLQNLRITPPGSFAPVFASHPAGSNPVNPAADSAQAISRSAPSGGLRTSPSSVSQDPPTILPRNMMEGLAHQGPELGPPSTLHDRVIFVSNVSVFVANEKIKTDSP